VIRVVTRYDRKADAALFEVHDTGAASRLSISHAYLTLFTTREPEKGLDSGCP